MPAEELGLQTIDGELVFLIQDPETSEVKRLLDSKMTVNQKIYYFDKNGVGVELSDLPLGSTEDGYYMTDNNYVLEIKDGIARIDDLVIVNKSFGLPPEYGVGIESLPENLEDATREAYYQLLEASVKDNIFLEKISAYRSYIDQQINFQEKLAINGEDLIYGISAKPGHSEHQLGQAVDFNSLHASFGETAEGKWIAANCWKFGFILRYPDEKTELTGYNYEPWHVRYVGKELAETLYNDGDWICIEEYFGLPSEYAE